MPHDFGADAGLRDTVVVPNDIASYAYDAVILAGLASCRSSNLTGTSLKSEILKGDFVGVSGRVLIDASIGSRTHETSTITLDQIRSNDGIVRFAQSVYLWGKVSLDANASWVKQAQENNLDFIGSQNIPPLDVVIDPENKNLIGPMKVLGKVLFGINASLSTFFVLWAYFNRNRVIIRYAQPMFLILIAVGCVVSSSTILFLGVEDEDHTLEEADTACMTVPVLYSLGFILTFAPLFTKLRRIHIIFINDSLRAIKVTWSSMMAVILSLLLIDGVILFLWAKNDPVRYKRVDLISDMYGVRESVGRCMTENNPFVFMGPIIALHVVVLLIGSHLAYLTRNIGTAFSESKYISISMISNLQVLTLAIPLLFLVADNPRSDFFVRAGVIFLNDFTVLLLIFVPKFLDSEFNMRILTTEVELTTHTRATEDDVQDGRYVKPDEPSETSERQWTNNSRSGLSGSTQESPAAASRAVSPA